MSLKNKTGSVTLNNVYYSPDAVCTLISAKGLRLGGGKIRVGNGGDVAVSFPCGFSFQSFCLNQCWQIPALVKPGKPPYVFVPLAMLSSPVQSNAITPDVVESFNVSIKDTNALMWHCRLGHIILKRIIKMCASGQSGLPKVLTNKDFVCEDCLASKSKRLRGQQTSEEDKLHPMHTMVSDVLGPFLEGFSGVKYLVVFRNLVSTYSEGFLLKKKDEVCLNFQSYIERMERLTGKKLKRFRTDGGGEFMSTKFLGWLADKGIKHQHSMPYEPEQNGAAERLHRTVGEIARTALIVSNLPIKFWGYAYLWGYFTHNRILLLSTNQSTIDRGKRTPARGIAIFPTPTPPEPVKSKLTLSSSLNKILNNGPDLEDIPLHKFDQAIKDSDLSPAEIPKEQDNAPVRRSIDKLLNPEDVSPTIFNAALVLGSNQAETIIKLQLPEATGLNLATRTQLMPRNYARAVNWKDGNCWQDAVNVELNNLWDMGVWHFESVPPGRKQTDARWLFDIKRNQDGSIKKYKARYIVRGFSQIFGQDYHDTWAPTATFASLRMLFTVAASNQWPIETFDITAAYLHGTIDEDVWVKVPDGMPVPKEHRGKSLKLDKGLYGTKQGGRCWWKHFVQVMEGLDFHVSFYDDSFYHVHRHGETILVWIHMDDGVVAASSNSIMKDFRAALESQLKTTWDGNLHNIVGIKVKRPSMSKIILSQPFLTQKIIDTFTTDSTLPRKIPIKDTNTLVLTGDDEEVINPNGYLSVVGSLNHLAVATRPDLAFAVGFLARFAKSPTSQHWTAIQQVLGYVKGLGCRQLVIEPKPTDKTIVTWVDANWGGKFSRSTHGSVTTFSGCPILWASKQQALVATSTCHAEFMALGWAARHSVWLKELYFDMTEHVATPTLMCDNDAAVKISQDNSANKRTRHSEREVFYVNEQIHRRRLDIEWVPSQQQLADIMTKALGPLPFERILACLNMSSPG
ncbi:hypothetical protein PCASD_12473 [Puccinia coronata f. sp. avenae]|uniref:Integrase catalytic domain-containing protein n=1 Tax=Puccinia coronata f. sp. avenae TaxID=200324 RepID=A0A2N5T9B9_9BASI|nr:hypothetical protein PCASD_15004 [Puccinia coronata f. sp. avenae]PLW32914.1 hypothetical protein PCASD_12473 [Puccinia coronata f. sp. avenae]